MRKIITCLLFLLPFVACKKDKSTGITEELLLTRISQNGKTQEVNFYITDNKLIRVDNYLSALSSYVLYEYVNDDLSRSFTYNASTHNATSRTEYTLDNFKRLIKTQRYTLNPDNLISVAELTYNTNDQLTSIRWRNSMNAIISLDECTYDNNGNLSRVKRTNYPNQPAEHISYQVDYTFGSRQIPAHWHAYSFASTGIDLQVLDMYIEKKESRFWNDDGELIIHDIVTPSQRVYNQEGYLVSQVLTTKYTVPAGGQDNVNEKTYEYTR